MITIDYSIICRSFGENSLNLLYFRVQSLVPEIVHLIRPSKMSLNGFGSGSKTPSHPQVMVFA